jgi:hypothetical protein
MNVVYIDPILFINNKIKIQTKQYKLFLGEKYYPKLVHPCHKICKKFAAQGATFDVL